MHVGGEKLVRLSQLRAGDIFEEASRSRGPHGRLRLDWLEQRARRGLTDKYHQPSCG